MRILFVGDVYGKTGREMVDHYLPKLKSYYKPGVTIVNGENAAHGKGITQKIYKGLMSAGADAVTLGNHTWDNKEIFEFIDDAKHMVRPANYPQGLPGKGMTFLNKNGIEIAVINLQGRTFLPAIDCPFQTADKLIDEARKRTSFIFVDFHAETTSEKLAMGWYLDGRVSAVVGTHTHVPTADERILDNGTAYLTDVGMTGPYDGIIGVEREAVIRRFKTALPVRFESQKGRGQLSAVIIDIAPSSGKATAIKRRLINDDHPFYD
ncbi:metallophosphoesterase (TIGR00282 family) [Pullulanibacillus pueri]|uniref:Metallophosphoesterase n=1 Tax=Pullulanibacillus pueri TaxID=1437324 RepID=A0A8J2ZWK5_9BACL|nr:TIGR00282 family metallophosphoesterase [Pullulanibacillus pueri]MBM7682547.1 metallophosphoesterase (TIGR00282 family) [Pullulanibacillus pueri]GGH81969.1 metallophosphoesterase [Pullulanibacillus pueri]